MSPDGDQYGPGFREFAARWESVTFEEVHAAALDLVPGSPGIVLDVGAGSGRDARWFAEHGWDVVAVEPSAALRTVFGDLHPRIRWFDDALPGLEQVLRSGLSFDLVWLSAVWMHVAPGPARTRAFR